MTDRKIFELRSAPLQSGVDFRNAKVSYKTYGQFAADKSNVIVVPSGYTITHDEVDWLTSAGKVLDPSRWFIISVSMLGNGLSSSPSNSEPPFDGKRYPKGHAYRQCADATAPGDGGVRHPEDRARLGLAVSRPIIGARCSPIWSSGSVPCAARLVRP